MQNAVRFALRHIYFFKLENFSSSVLLRINIKRKKKFLWWRGRYLSLIGGYRTVEGQGGERITGIMLDRKWRYASLEIFFLVAFFQGIMVTLPRTLINFWPLIRNLSTNKKTFSFNVQTISVWTLEFWMIIVTASFQISEAQPPFFAGYPNSQVLYYDSLWIKQ